MSTGADRPRLLAGKLRVEGEIGRGAMGVVLDAWDETLGRPVAVKVVPADLASMPAVRERLLREARAAAKLESPHAARVFEVGELPDQSLFIVMERLDGENLEGRLAREGPLPVADALRYVDEALAALSEAHDHGLVHRDVKPGNLFLARGPRGTFLVKVLDFGLVRDTTVDDVASGLTRTGDAVGTPAYMAPEQIRSSRTVDARADVWSVGITLFELLTGQLPFAADNVPTMLTRILSQDPTPLRSLRSDVPRLVEKVVARCLAKEPEARFADARELRAALVDASARSRAPADAFRTLPAGSRAETTARRPRVVLDTLHRRQNAVVFGVSVVSVLLLGGLGAVALRFVHRRPTISPPAPTLAPAAAASSARPPPAPARADAAAPRSTL